MVILKFKKTDTFDKKERILDRDCKITYKFNGLVNLQFRLFDDEVLHCEDRFECLGNRYVVKSIENYNVSCELDLNDFHTTFFNGKSKYERLTLIEMLKKITNWEILNGQTKTFRRTLHIEDCSAFKLLFDIQKIFDVAFVFDCINKTIKVVDEPNKTNLIVSRDVNLESIDMTTDTYEHYTRLYAYGKDGLSFSEINDGKDYVEDFTYNSNVISAVFRDDRFTNKDNLKAKALELLKIHCKPVTEFKVKVKDLGASFLYGASAHYAKYIKALSLHDEFYLENHLIKGGLKGRLEKYRVIELVSFTGDPQANEVTVVNRGRSLNKMLAGIDEKITTDVLRKVNDEFSSRFDENRKELEKHFEDLRSSGHKIEENGTIYFVDKLPKEQAKNVLKIGVGGIMGSSNGFLGPYETAITNDGRVNLNKAMVGELDGHFIRANTVDFDKLTMEAREKLKNGLVTTEEFSKFKLDKDGFNQYIEQKVNEKGEVLKKYTSDFFAEREEVIKHEFNSSIDNKANSLKSEFDSKANEINSNVDSKISNINKDVDSKIGNINKDVDSKIGEVNKSVDSKISDINSGIDSRIKSSDDKLRNEIGSSIGNIYDDLNKKNYELGQKQDKDIQSLKSDVDKKIDDKTGVLRRDINSNISKIDVNIKKIELIERETKKFREFSSTIDEFKSKIGEIEKNKFKITTESKNLCAETGETKKGNDLYFNTTETLKAGKEYYILAEARGIKDDKQWTKIYNANMKSLDFSDANYTVNGKVLVNGLNVWKVSYDHDTDKINIYPCGSDTTIKKVRIYEAVRREDKKNIYVSHSIFPAEFGEKFKKIVFKVSEKLQYGEIYAIEFNSGVQFKYNIHNGYSTHSEKKFVSNSAVRMSGENGRYFESAPSDLDDRYYVNMYVIPLEDSELKLYGDVKIYKSNIVHVTKNMIDTVDEISSQIRQTKSEITSQVMETKRNIDNTISEMGSQIRQTQSEIDLTVKKNDVINSINLSPEGVRIDASKVEITGSLHAYKGYIGGFEIGEKHGSQWFGGRNHNTGMYSGEYGHTLLWANWGNNWDNAKATAWYIDSTGSMYCGNNAKFNSYIEVEGGSFFKDDVHIGDSANIRYSNGIYLYSPVYAQLRRDEGYLHLIHQGSGEDWVQLWSDSSDRRYKRNIKPSKVKGLEVVNSLKTYSYTKEIKKYDIKKDIECGIMAQDVEKYAKDAFYKTPDDIYSYNPFELVPYLIKAIQELDTKVKKLDRLKLEEV